MPSVQREKSPGQEPGVGCTAQVELQRYGNYRIANPVGSTCTQKPLFFPFIRQEAGESLDDVYVEHHPYRQAHGNIHLPLRQHPA